MAARDYQVLEPLLHDGKRYAPGDSVRLDDTDGVLEGRGVLRPAPAPAPAKPASKREEKS